MSAAGTATSESSTFPRSCRLLTSRDFKAVFDNAVFKSSHRNILILTRPNGQSHARIGLVVAKKNAKLAVQRNRLKRLIRESFRLHQQDLSGLDIVALVKPGLWQQQNGDIISLIDNQLQRILQQASKAKDKAQTADNRP